jgi:integrase
VQIALLSPYDKFIKSCRSEVTKKAYAFILNRFMAHYELSDYEDILSLSVKQLEEMVVDYLLFMRKDNLSKSYVTQQISAIKRFLFMNDVVLNWNKIIEYKGEFKRKQKDEAYTAEQINKILQTCDSRSRVMVLIFASTGIRIGALPELRLRSLKKIGDLYQITFYEGYNDEYTTFCTPECATAIDSYLGFRERHGEKLTPESFLIRQEFDINDLEQIRKHSKPIASSTIRNVIWSRMVKAGIRDINHSADKHHRKTIPVIHGFRKFFTTQLVNAGLNTEKRWLLEGHALKGNDPHYVRVTEKRLQEEYFKALDLLTINPENRLRRKVEKLEVEKNQFERLAAKIASLEAKIK